MKELDQDVVNLTKAIRQAESGGNFTVRSKDGSFGAYQFIKPTWDATAKKFGVNAHWDKATPEQQNEVAYKQVKEWKDKGYNVGQIASMWNAGAGRPDAYLGGLKGTNKDGVNYDVSKYAEKVATHYQTLKNGGQLPLPPQQKQSGALRNFVGSVARPFEEIGGEILARTTGIRPNENAGLAGIGIKPITTGKQLLGDAIEAGSYALPLKSASLVGRTALGALSGYGFDVGSKLSNNKSVKESLKPGGGTLVGGSIPLVSGLVGKLTRGVTGGLTGTGQDVIKRAVDNPNEVSAAINKYAKTPELKKELVGKTRSALQSFTQSKQQEYATQIGKLTSKSNFQGKRVAMGSFKNSIAKFGGEIKNGSVVFKDTTLTKTDQNAVKQAYSVLSKWQNTSVGGLDGLRQAISNLGKEYSLKGNPRVNVVLGAVESEIKKSLEKNAPGYAKVLSDYGNKSQLVKEVIRELNLGGAAKESTQINSIMKLFKRDPVVLEKITKVMGKKEADKFINDLAGAVLSDWIPAGTMGNYVRALGEAGAATVAAISGNPLVGAGAVGGALASSPRIVGKTATAIGKASKAGVGRVITKLGGKLGSTFNQ